MYLISIGYLILSIIALSLHLNVMYVLAPYAILTFACINYTQKRSIELSQYWLGFEMGITEKGHVLKFFIFASSSHDEINMIPISEIKTLKVGQFQTPYILSSSRLQMVMANLNYLVELPCFSPQSVMHASKAVSENIDISTSNYEQIHTEYTIFKNSIINLVKQDPTNVLELNINQPFLNDKRKNRTSLTSFLR